MKPASLLILQLADAGYPAGGFAHSGGLEAALQAGEVRGARGLRQFVHDAVWQAAHGGLPLLTAAHRGGSLAELDARAEAFLVNQVAARASRTQGRAFLAASARIFPRQLAPLREAVRGLRLHHAPLFGAALAALGVDLAEAQQLYVWLAARGVLSAAVRLGACGAHEGQTLLAETAPLVERAARECADRETPAQTSPLQDLLSATHDRLYSRLFIS